MAFAADADGSPAFEVDNTRVKDPIEDAVTVEIEFKMKNKKRKMIAAGLFLLLILIVVIIAATSKSTSTISPYGKYMSEKVGSKVRSKGSEASHEASHEANHKRKSPPYQYPSPKPTRQPTRRPTRAPTPEPTGPPTINGERPFDGVLPPPTWKPTVKPSPTSPTVAAPTEDPIRSTLCSGVSILYPKDGEVLGDIFDNCPTSRILSYFKDRGLNSDRFSVMRLNQPSTEMTPGETQVGSGLYGFLGQVWKDRPIFQTHGDKNPYEILSGAMNNKDMSANDLRNLLNYGNSHRAREFIKRSMKAAPDGSPMALSAIGRTFYTDAFEFRWTDNIDLGHLSYAFRQRVAMLGVSGGTDQSIDSFISDFGTHYRRAGVFGGAYGVDYYFPNYGTTKDKANALQHVLNSDISFCFKAKALGQDLYTPEFRGFDDSDVGCYPWYMGGSGADLDKSIAHWQSTVDDNPVMIRDELVSLTGLMRVVGLSDVILTRFSARILALGEQMLLAKNGCLYNACPGEDVCVMNSCMPGPVPPRWPDTVSYCLPKPNGEICPTFYDEFWPGSWVYWDTEDGEDYRTYAGHDHITSHGLRPEQVNALKIGDRKGGIMLHFCCSREQPGRSKKWPKGTYCLYAYRYVSITYDHAWEFFAIVWNDEDDDNQNARSQPDDVYSKHPLGRYDNRSSFTEQTLLCRKDGPQEKPIVLPKSIPFYLIQYQDVCQEVFGMYWTHVQVTWDTENDHKLGGQVRWNILEKIPRNCSEVCNEVCQKIVPPDFCYVGHDKIVLDFCYYQEIETPSPTPMPTPSPIPPTPSPVFPTPPPTTAPPTGPPTKPPTRPPTPVPTRPTPSPIPPSKAPTPSPTYVPTPPPTDPPTPEPTAPTESPTPEPTLSPTPAPTPPCAYCLKMQGVQIVGLWSIWDEQPWELIFENVDCGCQFCSKVQDDDNVLHCPILEQCDIRLLVGDYMLLDRFWNQSSIELTKDDMIFRDVTVYTGDAIPNVDFTNVQDVREKTKINMQHARNALIYAGSRRMLDYGLAYSTLERHISSDHKDTVFAVAHVIPRTRVFRYVEVKWRRLPERSDLAKVFRDTAQGLYDMEVKGLKFRKKKRAYDAFIKRFGTHYVWHGIFGGKYGADFYFTGYGTKPEMQVAVIETKNTDLVRAFEHNRMRIMTGEPLGGRSFVRDLNGNAEVGPDIKGWSIGGSEYGIRGHSGDKHWRDSIQDDVDMSALVEHIRLVSLADLLNTYSEGFMQAHRDAVYDTFKLRVVHKAFYWLRKHYYCFFIGKSCEDHRKHPFLREDVNNAGCSLVTKRRLRSRTEMEVCVAQEDRNTGYLLNSLVAPYPRTKWCEGSFGSGVNTEIPSNFGPYKPVRKGFCPVVPPAPRWPVFFSYCFAKPVKSLSCPVEHFPEYNWNWDWEAEMKRSFHEHNEDHNKLADVMTENRVREDPWSNINPTNLIYSVYPWSYAPENYFPFRNNHGDESPWFVWLNNTRYKLNQEKKRRLKFLQHTIEHHYFEDTKITSEMIVNYIADKLKKAEEHVLEQTRNYYGNFLHTYTGDNVGGIKLWAKNKVYVLHQTPFIDYNGWAFWDSEDDTDREDKMGPPKRIRTKTHMDPAYLYKYDATFVYNNPNGFQQRRLSKATRLDLLQLWRPYWEINGVVEEEFRVGGVRMDYCCTTIAEDQQDKAVHRLHWPDGHLCVYAHGAIDTTAYKFLHGSVGWDCENGSPEKPRKYGNKVYLDPANEVMVMIDDEADQQRLTHSLPTGLYHIQYDGLSEQYFSQNILCMKVNPDKTRDIEVPRDRPFYLMQFTGRCQLIRGMYFTPVDLTWATEKDHVTKWEPSNNFDVMFIELEMNSWGHATAYGRRDHIPDGYYGQDKIMMTYCYYQPNIKPVRINNESWYSIGMNQEGGYHYEYAVNPVNSVCAKPAGESVMAVDLDAPTPAPTFS